ncbi:hypothetical protein [Stutzerimonas kunmingensis]|uniref:hypothetical protein n=1 Tax=Stutzerimonas kunmingensis TaxID=1211807 RepID=UPI00241D82E3|nr:hypothetical protein [Stutzerimonas kunmingensis]
MKTTISVDLDVVAQILADFRSAAKQPLTSEIIKIYMGNFVANTGIPAHRSWNAQFGKILSANRETLGLDNPTEENVTDDLGNMTTSNRWEFAS